MRFDFSLSQEQIQTLNALQIQSLQLLAMDNFELRQMMQKEYLENPILEYHQQSSQSTIQKGFVDDDRGNWEISAEERSLEDAITGQLNAKLYSKKEWSLIKFMIGDLDEHGFFQADLTKLAAMSGLELSVVQRLLDDLKKLEPCGIFAADVRECLLLQLQRREDADPLATTLVQEHLQALSRGEIGAIAKKLAVSPARIREALEVIAELNPRPLNGFDTGTTDYVVPDMLLKLNPETGNLETSLNDDWMADYSLSDYYIRMIRTAEDPKLREYFKKKYQRAKSLLDGIEQRRSTLLALGNFLAQVQREFLLGKGHKKALTMTEVAAHLELSVSTISRAVKGKYVQYPAGCAPLKELFAAPVSKYAPETPSRDAIKEALRLLIAQENKHAPYSDALLAEKLQEQQITISRRTVAKYRESLGIPGCFNRKQY